ncbi:MAG: hypothetical protein BIFFINMI_00962 [Phycisphaerae bacterium]|nr:hypothetical protein [Phycisphaerae bacterium]
MPDDADLFGAMDAGRTRLARLWAASGWRGGVGGACWFDELLAPTAMASVAAAFKADAVALLSPFAALLDAELVDATVALFDRCRARFRLAFSQAPPGLGICCVGPEVLSNIAATGRTLGRILAYDPAAPLPDFVALELVHKLPIDVVACPHRLLADTARSGALAERLIADLGDAPTAEQSARAATALFDAAPEPWPREIEIELTTQRAVADSLRPTAPARGPLDDAAGARLADWIAASNADDLLVWLGGCGDPLLHPGVFEMAAKFKAAGAMGVGLRTAGVTLDDAAVGRLLDAPIDLVEIELDAHSAETYARLKGADAYGRVTTAMADLMRRRDKRGQAGPLIVAQMIKCPATLDEMEAFFDHWRSVGADANLAGLSDYGGRFVSAAGGPGWPTAPPARRPCVRLARRMTVLADGTVPACDQDFAAAAPVARVNGRPLADAWTCDALTQLRIAHRSDALADHPLCAVCREWHRP